MGKALVTYFSASGVTTAAAQAIAAALGADLWEIRPQQPYTAADLDWRNKQSRSSLEMTDPAARPAICGPLPPLSEYAAVFVGFPIWWGVEPRAVDAFLEQADLAGKALVPFATSGGSGIAAAERSLRQHLPGGDWRRGRIVTKENAADFARGAL